MREAKGLAAPGAVGNGASLETDAEAHRRANGRFGRRSTWRGFGHGALRKAVLRRDSRFRHALAIADVISAASAVTLGVTVIADGRLTLAALGALPLVVLVSKILGLYDRDENLLKKTTLDEVPALFQVATLYTLLIWFLQDVFVDGHLGQQQMLAIWVLLLVGMTLGRALARRVVEAITPPERCLVLGEGFAARAIEAKFKAASLNAAVVGRAPLDGEAGDLDWLRPIIDELDVHRVVIASASSDSEENLQAIRQIKLLGVKVSVFPRLFEVVGSSLAIDDVDGLTLLGVSRYGLTTSSEVLKRAMDVVVATLSLIVLAPVMLAIGLWIVLTSPGPALFRQPRVGRDGAQFELLKFRTMMDGADELKPDLIGLNEAGEGFFKIADDPRMTRIGRFLRQTCLDELPQLLNVLRGEMSLVGPRPLVPDEDRRIEGWRRNRLLLKPGITGHWQIFGSSRIPLAEMVKIDYLYAANWSIWQDTKILLRTIPYVLKRSGL